MKVPWFGPTREEVEDLAYDLVERYGADAYESAVHLSEAYRSLGARQNEKLHRLAAIFIQLQSQGGREATPRAATVSQHA